MTGLVRRAVLVTTAAVASLVLGGCTFGDVPEEAAQPSVGPWFDDNCVPVECLFECCDGWNYSEKPILHGGVVLGPKCDEIKQRNSVYSEYVDLMVEKQNYCADDFKHLESGYCHVVAPPDVVKEFSADGQIVYAGLSFLVCPQQGQYAAHPVVDVEIIFQE